MSEAPLGEPVSDGPIISPWRKLANNPPMLCAMLFLVMGVLGVPLIFYSQRLTMLQKVALSVVVTLYTLFLIWLAYLAVMWACSEWSKLQ